ncbi:radical SAM protein [Chondromyces apiculatus]|uniref:radical SAM protein n=1 Tax=Chondromyces apiculatus TaxID=51 RepID=UPI0005C54097|nr:radical SAM protein [Chondromyces apiculatus]
MSADKVWWVLQRLAEFGPEAAPFKPRWSDKPIPRGKERTKPPLGWPRETDSLCPRCVKEARTEILSGRADWTKLITDKPGEIKARIVEKGGQIVMEKTCPTHGDFSDVLSMDPAFLSRIEGLFGGRDVEMTPDKIHDHGSSTIRYGRGSVLTVDLTNRCNMMCDPCFMDANQVGYVHELSWEEIKQIIDDAAEVRPRRQMSIQFSGGEPTMSPHFLDAIRYAREKGYFAVQCATNGLRFAQEPGFAQKAKEAGLRMAYLQFDGVTNAANSHRKIKNLYDVKLRAIEELAAAKIDVILVVTIINGVNNDQVGPIIEFAVENADKVTVVSFQPVSFTGRDEDISDELRDQQRYTLSHLAHDVAQQTGVTHPHRDWFPLSSLSPFGDVTDMLDGPDRDWGTLNCGCHPNCGIGTVLFVNKRTKQTIPLLDFLDVEGLLQDLRVIFDQGRGRRYTLAQLSASLLRHYRPEKAPPGFHLPTLIKQFLSQTGAAHAGENDASQYEWRVLFVAGMWFQDLFNYDFRRTEMCIIPYGTQMGEISFCAYNTGAGWRNILEKMKANATVAEWYKRYGRHPVYAKNKDLALPEYPTPLTIKEHGLALDERAQGQASTPRPKLKHLPVIG